MQKKDDIPFINNLVQEKPPSPEQMKLHGRTVYFYPLRALFSKDLGIECNDCGNTAELIMTENYEDGLPRIFFWCGRCDIGG